MTRIMVYGTLMKGFGNHRLLEGSRFVGNCETLSAFEMTATSGIPFVSCRNQTSRIQGELYEVDNETLKKLDYLEGHPEWYKRYIVNIELDANGRKHKSLAWLYFNDKTQGAHLVEDGNFRNFKRG